MELEVRSGSDLKKKEYDFFLLNYCLSMFEQMCSRAVNENNGSDNEEEKRKKLGMLIGSVKYLFYDQIYLNMLNCGLFNCDLRVEDPFVQNLMLSLSGDEKKKFDSKLAILSEHAHNCDYYHCTSVIVEKVNFIVLWVSVIVIVIAVLIIVLARLTINDDNLRNYVAKVSAICALSAIAILVISLIIITICAIVRLI